MELDIDPREETERIVNFIRSQAEKRQTLGLLVGLSGGLDSSVTAALAVRSLGSGRVFGLYLPDRDSSRNSEKDARLIAEHLRITLRRKSITPILSRMGVYRIFPGSFLAPHRFKRRYVAARWSAKARELGGSPFKAYIENRGDGFVQRAIAYLRAKNRVRMATLYLEAERRGLINVGTLNLTEHLMGLYVLWGDSSADIMPIRHLLKTQVRQLAEYLGVPAAITRKTPSPDLVPGLTDEGILGYDYLTVDTVLLHAQAGKAPREIAETTGFPLKQVEDILETAELAEPLRRLPLTVQQPGI